jgi:3',5'-cyclic-AMP phosphodiesterase
MKKKKKAIIISLIIFTGAAFISIYFNRELAVLRLNRTLKNNVDLSIAILGDIHSKPDRMKNAVKDLYKINPKIDALVLNGDTVDQGLDSQYKAIKRSLLINSWYLPKLIFKNIGNHEFYDYEKGENSPEDVEKFVNKYLEFAGRDKVYSDAWINSYHLIFLGSEKCFTPELGSTQAYISKEQQDWLKQKLSEGYERDRPIFVFLHQHLSGEDGANQFRWVGAKQDTEIKEILSKYKEVFLFTSHTHSNLTVTNKYITKPFSAFHTGAISNSLEPDGKGGRRYVDGSQGLYVEVVGNEVVIRGRDFKSRTWIEGVVNTINLR